MISKWLMLSISILITVSISPVYAQHHSGAVAPPVDFGGMQVALTSILTPEDFTYEDKNSANLLLRFFDSSTNTSIKSVTYRVQIFQGENLVASEYFYDENGNLDLEIKPTEGCVEKDLWKCTKYFGEKHPIAGGYYGRGDSRPVIQGPVFDKGGLYDIKVSIVGATNPRTMTATDLYFETFLSIPEKQNFLIQTADAQEFPILIKSFEGKILNFNFDESNNKISYDAPLSAKHGEEHHVQSKQIIQVEKRFSGFKEDHSIEVYVNEDRIEKTFLLDSAHTDKNIIKIDIPEDTLKKIQETSSTDGKDTMKIEILPGKQIHLNELNFHFDNGKSASVSWNSEIKIGENTPFKFSFFDANNIPLKNALYAYNILDSNGEEVWSNIGNSETYLGIMAQSGINEESITIPNEGNYQLKLILTGEDRKNYEGFFSEINNFEIINKKSGEITNSESIAPWIKSNAGWWADGIVGDDEFINSIQFLINEKIIIIPDIDNKSSGTQEIPSWIKSNAGWWAEDLISDGDFIKGIQFLAEEGIIIIN